MSTDIESFTAIGTVVQARQKAKQFRALFDVIEFQFNLDEDSIAADVGATGTITVTGAALGDFVLVAPRVDIGTALQVTAIVSDTNTVRVNIFNAEGTDAVTTLAANAVWDGIVLKKNSGFSSGN